MFFKNDLIVLENYINSYIWDGVCEDDEENNAIIEYEENNTIIESEEK